MSSNLADDQAMTGDRWIEAYIVRISAFDLDREGFHWNGYVTRWNTIRGKGDGRKFLLHPYVWNPEKWRKDQ